MFPQVVLLCHWQYYGIKFFRMLLRNALWNQCSSGKVLRDLTNTNTANWVSAIVSTIDFNVICNTVIVYIYTRARTISFMKSIKYGHAMYLKWVFSFEWDFIYLTEYSSIIYKEIIWTWLIWNVYSQKYKL